MTIPLIIKIPVGHRTKPLQRDTELDSDRVDRQPQRVGDLTVTQAIDPTHQEDLATALRQTVDLRLHNSHHLTGNDLRVTHKVKGSFASLELGDSMSLIGLLMDEMLKKVETTVTHQPEHVGIDIVDLVGMIEILPQLEETVMNQILGILTARQEVTGETHEPGVICLVNV